MIFVIMSVVHDCRSPDGEHFAPNSGHWLDLPNVFMEYGDERRLITVVYFLIGCTVHDMRRRRIYVRAYTYFN